MQIDDSLRDWILYDTSAHAQRVRELLRGTVSALSDAATRFERWAGHRDHHRRMLMRRKLRKVVLS
jgi:hypothetical protein